MDRDALVERMAEAAYRADPSARTPWHYLPEKMKHEWRTEMRAALHIAEPAIREDEREACAAMVDCACAHKKDVLAVRDENSGDRWRACGRDPCGALEARAIRARKEPRTCPPHTRQRAAQREPR